MKPSTDRPEACAIDGKVHVFVGGYHQVITVEAAETLALKISDSIAQAKGEPINCGRGGEIHYQCRVHAGSKP